MLGSVGPEVAMESLPWERVEKWRNRISLEQSMITKVVVCQKWQQHRKDQEVTAVGPKLS